VLTPPTGQPGTAITVSLQAGSNAQLESFPLTISGSFPLPNAVVTRTTRMIVTVTDFNLTVQPTSLSVQVGSLGEFTVNVSTDEGFEAPMTMTVTGLPQGAKMLLLPTNGSTLLTVPGTVSLAIQMVGVKQGTYTITLTVKASLHAGGYVIHTQEIQITVR